ncbi:MAG: alpha/beta hydrolase [Dongiaceae bacterium]
MRPDEYPPQEPFSENAQRYHDEVMRRGEGVVGEELSYGDDPYQSILICPAADPDGSLLAFMHGGGWTNGYKEWMAFMAPAFNENGVGFASIGYRLAPQHLYPLGLENCAGALAAVYENAGEYGIDSRRLFLGGHSAGGHYASLLAVRRDWQAGYDLPADIVRGCLPISGVYDFGPDSGLAQRPRFLGPADNDLPASPLFNIEGEPPPFFLAHGDCDFPHLIRQAAAMEEALRARGGDATRLVLAGRDHFSASYAGGEPDGPWVNPALVWIKSH